MKNKYNAKKTVVDGITFDSGMEARYYSQLKLREKAGEISQLELQPVFKLDIEGRNHPHRIVNCGKAIMDFRYFDEAARKRITVDVKGLDTSTSRLKRKLVEALYGITVMVVKK